MKKVRKTTAKILEVFLHIGATILTVVIFETALDVQPPHFVKMVLLIFFLVALNRPLAPNMGSEFRDLFIGAPGYLGRIMDELPIEIVANILATILISGS